MATLILMQVMRGRDGAVSYGPWPPSTATGPSPWPHGASPPRRRLPDARGQGWTAGAPDADPRRPHTPARPCAASWRVWAYHASPTSAHAAGPRPVDTSHRGPRAYGYGGGPAPHCAAPRGGTTPRPRLASRARSLGRCAA